MNDDDLIEQLDKLLASRCVSWLFGAGISRNAGVPLMGPLTDRVAALAAGGPHEALLVGLRAELPPSSHVEHLLSQLADHIALAERSLSGSALINGTATSKADLIAGHEAILGWIAQTIRWGYVAASGAEPERIGKIGAPLVQISEHEAFAKSLFTTTHAGVAERRAPVKIFTLNYDTLIEDSLALCGVTYWDGFDGGAVAFRSYRFGAPEPKSGYRAHVIKLHGSIDWHLDDDGKVWRVRDSDPYPIAAKRVLIYPQATKYVATQRDPFASQFDIFRRQISAGGGHVLVTCGYSFGDEHINDEIASAMSRGDNDTALIAFCSGSGGLPACLDDWRRSAWGTHVYILTQGGVYVGDEGPFLAPAAGDREWWKFSALSKILSDGLKDQLS